MTARLYPGDCLATLRTLPEASVDAVVTDPPYGLAFMGKTWDYDVPPVEVWAECLRVLKPGGHLLAFAGTRTQHRMACRIEDAGFEIRDMVAWVYGSGFPKSLDVSKAIDKAAGVEGRYGAPKSHAHAGWIDRGRMRGSNGHEGLQRPWMSDAEAVDRNARQYVPATDAAKAWAGWGTALKPALEPITVARKPLVGTVAANVLQHGTGALNIDGCRVEGESTARVNRAEMGYGGGNLATVYETGSTTGRWPANLVHDGSEEVVERFPADAGAVAPVTVRNGDKFRTAYGAFNGSRDEEGSTFHGDSGSAARFFYCAKASRDERGPGNDHPTVKPLALMAWLCRLVTPPGGTVLDPYMGSGTTGVAATGQGFRFIGCEREPDYLRLAADRIGPMLCEVAA